MRVNGLTIWYVLSVRHLVVVWLTLALTAAGLAVGYPMPLVLAVSFVVFGMAFGIRVEHGGVRSTNSEMTGVFSFGLLILDLNWWGHGALGEAFASVTIYSVAEWWFSRHASRLPSRFSRAG